MLYKALKSKDLKNVFGVFTQYEKGWEIAHSDIPELRPYSCTMEGLIKLLEKDNANKTIIEQLNDYDMVVVDLTIY